MNLVSQKPAQLLFGEQDLGGHFLAFLERLIPVFFGGLQAIAGSDLNPISLQFLAAQQNELA